ncbi:NAD(P)-dependent oxidoreductase [Ruminococcus sp.]|uniref:NAD(P)-dependent oxidoreductase n=1 Tax=Ruminococcus sp. TaxID=41978 RepID=UPI0025FA7483|nr:NAD(P)-dependent oxidoreductase [Ruminococcus sp.]MBQ8966393.1 NAD(P)-binding domain-containing protein [Ruminococcus sp.]
MKDRIILCAGEGARFKCMCEGLCGAGRVFCMGERAAGTEVIASPEEMPFPADVLVLQMMCRGTEVCGMSFGQLTEKLKPSGTVLGGRLTAEQREFFEGRGFGCADYFGSESLMIKNCIPTAEGALMIALRETADTVFGSRVLITGWGRTAKCCARLFKAAGATVTVAARKQSAMAEVWAEGMAGVSIAKLSSAAEMSDIIINTVPALVLTEEVLAYVKPDSLIIDLASGEGGTDFTAAKVKGIKAILAPGLPAKTAPRTAGLLLAEEICGKLSERSEK